MITATCQTCGSLFRDYACKIRDGRRFCSHRCSVQARIGSLEKAFFSGFKQREVGECWEWLERRFKSGGYGALWDSAQKKTRRAHRVSYEIHIGPIPDGLFVCHHCDNPPCVNPAHLFLGTVADNTADMDRKGRRVIPNRKGEANSAAILTEQDVHVIRATSGPAYLIAGEYGVSAATINNVRSRKNWRHV